MSAEHPDTAWASLVRDAFDAWLAKSVPSPTSQITGGGAIAQAEARLSALHHGRRALFVHSATYGMYALLASLGIGEGAEVLIPALDWTSTFAAVRGIGATPVAVPVDPRTLTIDPSEAAARRSARTQAVVACHLLGIPADVPGLEQALPGIPVLGDAAQAFGSELDGVPAAELGHAAILSFGPGKTICSGEGAAILADAPLFEKVLRTAAHPVRQVHSGLSDPGPALFSVRPHPVAAVLLDHALDTVDTKELIRSRTLAAARVQRELGVCPLGADERRGIASKRVHLPPSSEGAAAQAMNLSATSICDIEALIQGEQRVVLVPSIPVLGTSSPRTLRPASRRNNP